MRSRAGFCFIGLVACAIVLVSCKGSSGTGGSGSTAYITLAGNSVARNVYEHGLIPAFKAAYAKAHPGQSVDFVESYDGSGAQTRAILSGLKADVAALSLAPEVDKLAAAGLVDRAWYEVANGGVPATSVVVMVVRQGNPKKIKDWQDLTRQDVDVVLPNADTSGAAQWNVAAIFAGHLEERTTANTVFGNGKAVSDADSGPFFSAVRKRVKAFGKSGKEAMQIFSSGVGDVIVGWECEAMDRKAAGDPIEIVYPSTTIQMEPPVAVVALRPRANPAAAEFVAFLGTPEAQRIYAQNHYRPHDPAVEAEVKANFPEIKDLVTIDKLGGWPAVQWKLFGPEGMWTKAGE